MKKRKNKFQKVTSVFVTLAFIGFLIWSCIFAFNYMIEESESEMLSADGTVLQNLSKKKDEINALICGVNDNLTDTMIYIKYNVKTGQVAMMSIPRDTYVTNEYCVGNKLNGIYRGKNVVPLVKEVQELLDVKIDYYLIFETTMIHELVDAVGGVEVDVPIRMKYDDATQDLHIDLQKGVQVLNGQQAEMFVRFRHNNDMSVGYSMGDLGRVKVQQTFIKAFISTVLSTKNIPKIPQLIDIALNNTDTNVTTRIALKYVSDVKKINMDNIVSCTAIGEAKYINNISYFILDKDKTRQLIKDDFSSLYLNE